MRSFFAAAIIILIASSAYGQKSWFDITIDPVTGAYTKIDSIPDVTSVLTFGGTTYDQHHGRFILETQKSDGSLYLISVNAASGNVLSDPILPDGSNGISFNEYHYNTAADTLCAIEYPNFARATPAIAAFNTATAAYTTIDSMSGVRTVATNMSAMDGSGNITFIGYDANKVSHLYTYKIDPTTVTFQSNPAFPSHTDTTNIMIGFRYDFLSDSLYAFMYTQDSKHNYLIAADPVNGAVTVIDSFPDIRSVSPFSATYDQAGHRYMFIALNTDLHYYLYSVNTVTAAVTQNELSPVVAATNPDVSMMQYDSASGKIYAITSGATTTGVQESLPKTLQLQAFPNPSNNETTIQLDGSYSTVTALITNSLGQILRKDIFHGTSEINIQRGELHEGSYFVQLTGDGKLLGTVKLGVE
ncbi:MAG TPA: T9SS type A sorting domain-containing protein [Candidatus Kapabacteria bacterium]|nr:T9SS type A sorting domain-containing protein [Candidatus Kapabacteria bacterium]